MRFNSVQSSDYSQAARAVTKNMDSIYNTSRETAPDFTEIAEMALKTKSQERRAAAKAESQVARQGMVSSTKLAIGKLEAETEKKVKDIKRPAKRMAGVVAGLGTLTQAWMTKKDMDAAAADAAELKGLRQEQNALLRKQIELSKTRSKQQEEDQLTTISELENEIEALESGSGSNTSGDSGTTKLDGSGKKEPPASPQISPPKTSVSSTLQSAQSPGSFDLSKLTQADYEKLAFAVSGEAGPGKDKFGVAASILNRVASDKFPNTVSQVVHAPGQYQAVYEGNSWNQPDVAKLFQSPEGQKQLQEALTRLDGRTDFKGQTMLHNRSNKGNKDYDGDGVPDMDIMFDPKGNFFHYHWQT